MESQLIIVILFELYTPIFIFIFMAHIILHLIPTGIPKGKLEKKSINYGSVV